MSENPYEKYYMNTNPECNDSAENFNNSVSADADENDFEITFEDDFAEVAFEPSGDGNNSHEAASCEWYGGETPVSANFAQYYPQPQAVSIGPDIKAVKSKSSRAPLSVVLLLFVVVSIVFGGGSALIVDYFSGGGVNDSSVTIHQVSPSSQSGQYSNAQEVSTVEIVDEYADSVVEIITESVTTGVFSQQYIQSGAGSGVIIDSKGYIVTNHHVIEGARKISVTLRDGTTYTAQLIGSDAKMDLALLKIEAENLTFAVFGDSDSLKVGQRTIAIGNPLGQLGGTVTEGIISALDRDVTVDGQTMNLLQTDTAINPGNSGGGMFDGKGNLIGIVVAKSSGSEVEGLGFAIPINDAISVISDLMDYGYVRGRVDIGMEFLDVSSDPVAWMYGLTQTGCYVYTVDKDSNADVAGFESGDLILKVDGVEVNTSDEIEEILSNKNVGEKIEFVISRNSSVGTVTLELQEYVPESSQSESQKDNYIIWNNYG